MISVLILTKNEELDLPGCLGCLEWCDDVHVYDSWSEDRTCEIALNHGVSVHRRKFDNYAAHKNAALATVNFKYQWVYLIDADERLTPGLVQEMLELVANPPVGVVVARSKRRDYFMGRWLRYSSISPFNIRLMRRDSVRFEREINEVLVYDGKLVDLQGHFDHYSFSKGISHWIDKHNKYSSMEAVRAIEERKMNIRFSWKLAFFCTDRNKRRYHQKGIFYKIPGRPFVKFFYMLFFRGGVLDGLPGIHYALLQMIYEYFIVLKQYEASSCDDLH